MVDIQTVSIAIASASVVAGVVYYALQIRHQGKVRQTDLVIKLSSDSGSREFTESYVEAMSAEFKDYDDFVSKYGKPIGKNPVSVAVLMMCNFHEQIGILLRNKLIDPYLVFELFAVALVWEKMKPIVEGMRKEYDEPRLYEWFEYLDNEMKKREQELQQSKT